MTSDMERSATRRQVLGLGCLTVGGLMLGCAGRPRSTAALPAPVWPASSDPYVPGPRPSGSPVEAPVPVVGAMGVERRSAWASEPPRVLLADRMRRIQRITIHHDAMPSSGMLARGDAADRLRAIQRAHFELGWADIGYHYAIDPAGRVWEGRPTNLQGAHVRDQNERNLGIVVLGNFMHEQPTPAAVAALRSFVGAQALRYRVPPARVRTHRELAATQCPGTWLQRAVDNGRRSGVPGLA
ncbi:MAG: peptidoglycan recognition family protein [Planctomycetota bacterium]